MVTVNSINEDLAYPENPTIAVKMLVIKIQHIHRENVGIPKNYLRAKDFPTMEKNEEMGGYMELKRNFLKETFWRFSSKYSKIKRV